MVPTYSESIKGPKVRVCVCSYAASVCNLLQCVISLLSVFRVCFLCALLIHEFLNMYSLFRFAF
jgi:hypothetical protein